MFCVWISDFRLLWETCLSLRTSSFQDWKLIFRVKDLEKKGRLLYPFSCEIYCQAIQRVVVKWSHKSTQHNLFRFLFSPLRPFTPTYTWTVLHKIVFTLPHFCNPKIRCYMLVPIMIWKSLNTSNPSNYVIWSCIMHMNISVSKLGKLQGHVLSSNSCLTSCQVLPEGQQPLLGTLKDWKPPNIKIISQPKNVIL